MLSPTITACFSIFTFFIIVTTMLSPVTWVGGKRWLVPLLHGLYGRHIHRRLVEPFCGGASIAFGLEPQNALLNDVNPHLINFFRFAAKGFSGGITQILDKSLFLHERRRFNKLISQGSMNSEEAARIFLRLNRACFRGRCPFNKSGQFTGTFGSVNSKLPEDRVQQCPEIMKLWSFCVGTFHELQYRSSDFIYADPPYLDSKISYQPSQFDWDEHVQLATLLAKHRGPVAVSHSAFAPIMKLYRELGFEITVLSAPRSLRRHDGKSRVSEMLAVRNLS